MIQHALLETEAEKMRNQVLAALQHVHKLVEEVRETSHKLEVVIQQIEGYSQLVSDGQGGTVQQMVVRNKRNIVCEREMHNYNNSHNFINIHLDMWYCRRCTD